MLNTSCVVRNFEKLLDEEYAVRLRMSHLYGRWADWAALASRVGSTIATAVLTLPVANGLPGTGVRLPVEPSIAKP